MFDFLSSRVGFEEEKIRRKGQEKTVGEAKSVHASRKRIFLRLKERKEKLASLFFFVCRCLLFVMRATLK